MILNSKSFFNKRVGIDGLLTAIAFIVCSSSLIGFVGHVWWVFELFSHFRIQYFAALSIISLIFACSRKFKIAIFIGCFAILNLFLILPYYTKLGTNAKGNSNIYKAIFINVHTANQKYHLVKELILKERPDFIVLAEVNNRWIKGIEEIEKDYPFYKLSPSEDNFGIALYSRHPFIDCKIKMFGTAYVPSIVSEFNIENRRFILLGTHPLPPTGKEYSQWRNEQLDAIAKYLSTIDGHKMLIGDLNTTPWSPYFTQLLKQASLIDSSKGNGIARTWPTSSFILRIPIDHCLVSTDIKILEKHAGEDIGSDHYPLIVSFTLQ
jgi:endonuclease/exonuclease/phosphatase (EEP) superfamily protein YafD